MLARADDLLKRNEIKLLISEIDPEKVEIPPSQLKIEKNKNGSCTWKRFLKPEEIEIISTSKKSSTEYLITRTRCISREWRSNKANRLNLYARNKKNALKKKLEKKIHLETNICDIIKTRSIELVRKKEKLSEKLKIQYRIKKQDPEFIKKDNENSRRFRLKNPDYMKKWREANRNRVNSYGTRKH